LNRKKKIRAVKYTANSTTISEILPNRRYDFYCMFCGAPANLRENGHGDDKYKMYLYNEWLNMFRCKKCGKVNYFARAGTGWEK